MRKLRTEVVSFSVLAVTLATHRGSRAENWPQFRGPTGLGISGPGGGYACPTPTTDGRLVYCAFGSSVLAALDFRGTVVWRKKIVPHTFDVTLGSSRVLYRDTLILLCAMAKASDSKLIDAAGFKFDSWEASPFTIWLDGLGCE